MERLWWWKRNWENGMEGGGSVCLAEVPLFFMLFSEAKGEDKEEFFHGNHLFFQCSRLHIDFISNN